MSSLTELDVVNEMLAGMGMAPKTSLTRPDRFTAIGIQKLRRWSRQIQARGWWFNDMQIEVTPDPENDFRVDAQLPCNLILVEGPQGRPLSFKEPGYLYDLTRGKTATDMLTLRVIYEVPFAELPDNAQFYIQDCAVLDFSGRVDGSKVDIDAAFQTASLVQLNAENTRQRKVNLLHSTGAQVKLLRIRGTRPEQSIW